MKKIIFGLAVTLFLLLSYCFAEDMYVNGYFREDGIYVSPNHRYSATDTVRSDYSLKSNTNSYAVQEDNYNINSKTNDYYGTASSGQSSGYTYDVNTRSYISSEANNNYYKYDTSGYSNTDDTKSENKEDDSGK